ncbi:TPA: helix-turn-helix transcriptional regulator [Clostridium perfringens]|uniref:Helix-turn-helix domain-containing protein n=1 Tax=Clostridium perfringens TaxID=1502 RepID=A0AAW9K6F2_CLOPF|nr:helix-turn-helix domain-containing protein [Clostridium perfringens]MDK0616146.1 helix-turn-helix domain-containing protein [Clostridium perfringens]MDZ4949194.1 helix-turn-helix domain-containing protein [Clostridium perfringens]MDZ7542191.1 helix-turn-helix domain-containing protein [Clostridium perfringens]
MKKINLIESIESVVQWVSEGKTQKEIAKLLGVSERTLRRYKQENEAFMSALEGDAKSLLDMAENELVRRAFPRTITEVKPIKVKKEYFKDGIKLIKEEVEIVEYKKRVEGDMQALALILKNKGEWKDNPHKAKIDEELLELKKKDFENSNVFI